MKAWIVLLIVGVLISQTALAEESKVVLEKVVVNPYDIASIKRGAKFFATRCIACHTVKFLRYDKLAREAGIIYEKMPFNIKISGISPPDLSLVTRWRSPEWVYTYLHSFYVDPKRPSGFNNLVFPNTAMLNIVAPLQGQLILAEEKIQGPSYHQPQWFDLLILQKQGAMTPEQFDETITDLVNFLAYASEPYRVKQMHLGYRVIGFLLVFFVLAYLLKQAYWKELKKRK